MAKIGEVYNLEDAFDHSYETREIKRGEIYYVDLEDIGYGSKHVQTKTRPALIIQNDIGNTNGDTVIIALLTTKRKKDYPFQYAFLLNNKESVIMFEQILTIDKFRLQEKFGELTYRQMKEAEKALLYSLQLNRFTIENVQDFEIASVINKKTKTKETTYFEIKINYEKYSVQTININLERLKQFDKEITKDIDFQELKQKLNCIQGLHWIAQNSEM